LRSVLHERLPATGSGKREGMTHMPEPVTLSQVVHRAVQVCDPDGGEGLGDLLARFEDADAPLSSVEAAYAEEVIAEVAGALDPQQEDPAVTMAAALATYLAYRRDEVGDGDEPALLERAARAEFDGRPPANVREWLAERGVTA
jgi:hypothetical protein